LDNGWNTSIAVDNMRRMVSSLKVDLEVVSVDWEEFSDLQKAFLKASVSDVEVPTDVAIFSVLHKVSALKGIKYILNGHSFRTEGIAPIGWTYMDARYIREVQKIFGTRKLRTFNNFGIREVLYYSFWKGIRVVPLLNYVSYDKAQAKESLMRDYGWEDYGGHHHESLYTKMVQSFLLPRKFKIDKRRTSQSARVRCGKISREAALTELNEVPYPFEPELVEQVLARLGISEAEWRNILAAPRKTFRDYNSYFPLLRRSKQALRLACDLGFFPKLLYLKYFGQTGHDTV